MKQRKKPSLRFKGFDNDWEQRKLGDYITIISGDAPSKFDEGNELYVKVDDLNCNSKYVIDSKNKVALHESINKAPEGSVVFPKRGAAIMTNKVRILADDCYIDTNLMALSSNKIDSEFLYNIISKEGLYKIADTSTIPQINNKHIEPYEVLLPRLDEQRTIGKFFKDVDNFITLHQRKLEKLQNLKKAMLEKMFPKNGAKVPEIRFKGFTNDWEQRKLGELATFNKGAGYSKSDLKASGTQIILYGRLYTKYETVIKQVDTFVNSRPGSVYSEGGEVIVPASGEIAEDIAIASVVEKPGILLGGDLNIIHPIRNLDSTFLAISISNGEPHKEMAKRAQGKSVVHLHNDDLSQIKFRYPSIEEQSKISKFFSNLDNLITLHQCKLEKLQNLKKAMLEKMFI